MGHRDGLCACGLAACVCFGQIVDLIESAHPHHDERPSPIIATVQIGPRHGDETHQEHAAFAGLRSRTPPRGNAAGLFWSGDDSALFWSGDDAERFWGPQEAEGSGTYFRMA